MKKNNKNINILVGITGGISSYKSCELIRLFIKSGYSIKVMMTESATKFVSPLVFQELSQNPVYVNMFQEKGVDPFYQEKGVDPFYQEKGVDPFFIQHISLSQWADICLIAPTSANTLSKIACGICDNLLTTVVLALGENKKVLFVPAMNENMWKNPIIVDNVKKLKGTNLPAGKAGKYFIMPPQKGELACGVYGEGRMPEPKDIYKLVVQILRKKDEG